MVEEGAKSHKTNAIQSPAASCVCVWGGGGTEVRMYVKHRKPSHDSVPSYSITLLRSDCASERNYPGCTAVDFFLKKSRTARPATVISAPTTVSEMTIHSTS